MITSISWVPKGASKSVPTTADPPTKEEIQELLKTGILKLRKNDENMNDDDDAVKQGDELSRALSAANALGKSSAESSKAETHSIADAMMELDMDNYDEEDDGPEIFGSGLDNLYYPSNQMDPYLKGQDNDSEEEDDITIKPDDMVIVLSKIGDDVSHLEVWIVDENIKYVHHDILIPAAPLCTAWLDCPLKGGDAGNFVAIGSMDPAIEIWDLDVKDEVQPSATLGGIIGTKGPVIYKDGSHTGSVLGLAWNKEYRNILASASKDKLVKIWDVATETCSLTLQNHTKMVQAVAWNHFSPQVLLSGSFDQSVVMKDSRLPSHGGFRWQVAAKVECLAWDPHTEHSFAVGMKNGTVAGFDIRNASSDLSCQPKPSFTINSHDKAVCTIAYNISVPNLLVTGSEDKMIKLWDLSNHPSCIASKNPNAGVVFSISFSEDRPFTLAVGGSMGKLKMWDILSDAELARKYGKYANQAKPPTS